LELFFIVALIADLSLGHPSTLGLDITGTEKTRQQLNYFIVQMKTALAALTGLGI